MGATVQPWMWWSLLYDFQLRSPINPAEWSLRMDSEPASQSVADTRTRKAMLNNIKVGTSALVLYIGGDDKLRISTNRMTWPFASFPILQLWVWSSCRLVNAR